MPYFFNCMDLNVFYRYLYAKIYSEIISASGSLLLNQCHHRIHVPELIRKPWASFAIVVAS